MPARRMAGRGKWLRWLAPILAAGILVIASVLGGILSAPAVLYAGDVADAAKAEHGAEPAELNGGAAVEGGHAA